MQFLCLHSNKYSFSLLPWNSISIISLVNAYLQGRDHMEDLDVDGRILLKLVLKNV
jgi:hypothetical protein